MSTWLGMRDLEHRVHRRSGHGGRIGLCGRNHGCEAGGCEVVGQMIARPNTLGDALKLLN